MLYVIIILSILVLFLLVRLLVLKSEMKRVIREMKDNPEKNQMNCDFIDADLQDMIVEVNDLYDHIRQIKAEGKNDEKKIKESISMISHDMRTPLTSIIGYLQVAEKSKANEEKEANIAIALDRAKYLNNLVNDFFEISLIESGQVNIVLERVNICELICEEILAESPEIDKKGIEPRFDQAEENIYVNADRAKLIRVIQNLISNAVKYSIHRLDFHITEDLPQDDKKINASVSSKVILSIRTDSSETIDTEKIFERFYQKDSSRTKGGAGLGLYICKEFVERMGGSISASQEEGTFEIALYLEKA
ncbi:Signal transduction histidine kinase [Lachnospiraceae bacterium NE2001]|nr:Signal transduction histidine kinase [Lachnospiraceae bacterium NE2001]